MVLLWLANTRYRTERSQQLDAKRRRLTLPQTPWLRRRFADNAIDIQWNGRVHEGSSRDREARAMVVGLIDVEPGSEWRGPCTPWSPEAQAMRAYYEYAADSYTIRVRRAFRLWAFRWSASRKLHSKLLFRWATGNGDPDPTMLPRVGNRKTFRIGNRVSGRISNRVGGAAWENLAILCLLSPPPPPSHFHIHTETLNPQAV